MGFLDELDKMTPSAKSEEEKRINQLIEEADTTYKLIKYKIEECAKNRRFAICSNGKRKITVYKDAIYLAHSFSVNYSDRDYSKHILTSQITGNITDKNGYNAYMNHIQSLSEKDGISIKAVCCFNTHFSHKNVCLEFPFNQIYKDSVDKKTIKIMIEGTVIY